MNKYITRILFVFLVLFNTACEEYLDLAPENDLEVETIFQDFQNAQGWVEELYGYTVDYGHKQFYQFNFNYGEDAIFNTWWSIDNNFDRGDLTQWYKHPHTLWVEPNGRTSASKSMDRPGIWDGWEAIRKANIAIESILPEEQGGKNLMVNATQAEKDILLGQAYFFRAFFHFQIMKYWGRVPYVDIVLSGDPEEFSTFTRPSTYKECALKADADFGRAAELLPKDWDEHPAGAKTLGQNKSRVTKGAAYGFKGKNLLFAASPLMRNSQDTYNYDEELCKEAINSFAEVLKLVDQGYYALVPFDRLEEVFYTMGTPRVWPGSTELVADPVSSNGHSYTIRTLSSLHQLTNWGGAGNNMVSPTHSYIHNNFGMADGLSCEDSPNYDPMKPFEGRDPRFYKNLIIDGESLSDQNSSYKAEFYIGGKDRGKRAQSQTGYIVKKWYPKTFNKFDKNQNFRAHRLYMRLTDIYLMYAEAATVAYGVDATPSSYPLSAKAAINMLRDRAGVPHVNAMHTSNSNSFMEELRRERAVELCYESHRWEDIRRWSVANLPKYKRKTALNFDKDHTYFEEELIVERVCDYPKHFWFPFVQDQTEIYVGWEQNPGW